MPVKSINKKLPLIEKFIKEILFNG